MQMNDVMSQSHSSTQQQKQPRAQQRPFVVAITGGIACGKSAVSHYLAEKYHLPVIDTDVIAREIVQPQQYAWQQIVQRYGQTIIDEQQQLKRKQLRDIIFNDDAERQWLNQLTHPLIEQQVKQHITASKAQRVLVIIPLLDKGSHYLTFIDHILVVDCDEQQQIQRLIHRDGINAQLAQQMLNAQPSRQARLQLANSVIHNNNDLTKLYHDCDHWLAQLTTV